MKKLTQTKRKNAEHHDEAKQPFVIVEHTN